MNRYLNFTSVESNNIIDKNEEKEIEYDQGDNYYDELREEEKEENGAFRLKLIPQEITTTLNTVENIRTGSFNYKDLAEIFVLSNLKWSDIMNEKKKEESMEYEENNNIYMIDNEIDKICIIRFPLEVSNQIKKYLLNKKLQLEIYPTKLLNSRFFIINFKNLNKKYVGVLVELSTHIEVHKTLDGHNLFKANDVSQMLYVLESSKKNKKLLKRIIKNNYQLNCGISHQASNFHFQNYPKMYKYHDIFFAQKVVYDYLNGNFYDFFDFEVKTYHEMKSHIQREREENKSSKRNRVLTESEENNQHKNLAEIQTEHTKSNHFNSKNVIEQTMNQENREEGKKNISRDEIVNEDVDIANILRTLDDSFNLMTHIENEIGNISFDTLLNFEIEKESYDSDVSDLIMGGDYYFKKKTKKI